MARRTFPKEKIDQVIRFRQKGDSWLKIQKEAEVPRRAAKRLYEEWEQSKSMEDLRAARRDVAAEELRKHLDTLVDFAEFLISSLDAPKSLSEEREAETVFNELLRRNIYPPEHRPNMIDIPRMERRVLRHNRMLLKSLQEHTDRKVSWKILEEWKKRWNDCITTLVELKKQTNEVTKICLKLRPGFEEKLLKETGKKDAVERISEAVLNAAWFGATLGSLKKEHASFVVPLNEKNKVMFDQNRQNIRLIFTDQKLRDDVAGFCTQATENLFLRGIPEQLKNSFNTVKNKVVELEEMLDPIVLRPLILKNRCGLCPV